jgi:hypothetical protein
MGHLSFVTSTTAELQLIADRKQRCPSRSVRIGSSETIKVEAANYSA